MAKTKVTFRKYSVKQLVKLLDPKPKRETSYQFSNGRTFKEPVRKS